MLFVFFGCIAKLQNWYDGCVFDNDRDNKAYPQHDDERALRGDCKLCVRAVPTLVDERKSKTGKEYRICENQPADERVERFAENERQNGKEESECKRYAAVVDADFRFARVVYGLDGILSAEFLGLGQKDDRGAEKVYAKTDCRHGCCNVRCDYFFHTNLHVSIIRAVLPFVNEHINRAKTQKQLTNPAGEIIINKH